MKLAAAALATALAWPGCSSTEPLGPVPIEVGKAFSLGIGASARAADLALEIGVDAVSADSRCARGDRCIRAGDATVRVWWQLGTGARHPHELHVAPGSGQTLRLPLHELRLLRLDPYPITGRPAVGANYVATLVLAPAPAGDPTR